MAPVITGGRTRCCAGTAPDASGGGAPPTPRGEPPGRRLGGAPVPRPVAVAAPRGFTPARDTPATVIATLRRREFSQCEKLSFVHAFRVPRRRIRKIA